MLFIIYFMNFLIIYYIIFILDYFHFCFLNILFMNM